MTGENQNKQPVAAAGNGMPAATNIARVTELLTFDPTKENLSKDVLSEALKEITEERITKLKSKGKEQLHKAIELVTKMNKLKKDFDTEYAKCDKELGKIVRQVEAAMQGKTEPVEEKEEKKD